MALRQAFLERQILRLASRFGMASIMEAPQIFEATANLSEREFRQAIDVLLSYREHTDPPRLQDFEQIAAFAGHPNFVKHLKLIARKVEFEADKPTPWWKEWFF